MKGGAKTALALLLIMLVLSFAFFYALPAILNERIPITSQEVAEDREQTIAGMMTGLDRSWEEIYNEF